MEGPRSPPWKNGPMQTFSWDAAAELAVVVRSGFTESRHIGSAAVTGPDGGLVHAVGDPGAPVYARSALKPFQAIASLTAGAPLRGAQVAIAAGSHAGSFEHMTVVAGMLEEAGLTPEDLACPPAYPSDPRARAYLLGREKPKQRIAMNCSGKHAAFLRACVENGWDTAGYLDPGHPLQRLVMEVIEETTGAAPAHVGVDGCGAPVAALPLEALARGYGRLGSAIRNIGAEARTATLATAMVDYPEMVEGPGRPDTVVSEELDVVAKLGAEGILAVGTREGAGVAVKVLDGSARATTLVALTLLARSGFLPGDRVEAVLERVVRPVLGGEEPVGGIELGAALAGRTAGDAEGADAPGREA